MTCQGRSAGCDADDLSACRASNLDRPDEVERAASRRDGDDHVRRSQECGRHGMNMRIRVCDGRDPKPKELMLSIECHNSRTSLTIELDASRLGQDADGGFQNATVETVTQGNQ